MLLILWVIVNILAFLTLDSITMSGSLSVSNDQQDGAANMLINFTKIGTLSGYTIDKYELVAYMMNSQSVFQQLGTTILLDPAVSLPYMFSGVFGKSYKFKVRAKVKNSLDEISYSTELESDSLLLVDEAKIVSTAWTHSSSASHLAVSVALNGNISTAINLLLLAQPLNSSESIQMFNVPSLISIVDGVANYSFAIYNVEQVPQYMLVVGSTMGSDVKVEGFGTYQPPAGGAAVPAGGAAP